MMNRVRKAQVVYANYRLGKDLDKDRPLSGLTLAKFINHLKKLATRHAQTYVIFLSPNVHQISKASKADRFSVFVRSVAARDITAGTILEYGAWGVDEMKKVLKSVVEGPCSEFCFRSSESRISKC